MDIKFLSLLGVIQGVLITAVLLTRKTNSRANLFLALFIFVLSFEVLVISMGLKTVVNNYRIFNLLFHVTPFLLGPILYLYVKFLVDTNYKLKFRIGVFHSLPFIIAFLISLLTYVKDTNGILAELYYLLIPRGFLGHLVYDGLKILSITLYGIQIFKLTGKFRDTFKMKLSNIQRLQKKWINQLVILSILLVAIISVLMNLNENGLTAYESPTDLLFIMISIFIYWLTYKAITRSIPFPNLEDHGDYFQNNGIKYAKSGLKEEEAQELIRRIENYMKSEKPYLSSTITLEIISKELKVYKHHISQLLNDKMNTNFYAYINRLRIIQVEERLIHFDSKKETIEGIAFECGFNSKSTFNTLFKKVTGFTPTNYIHKKSR